MRTIIGVMGPGEGATQENLRHARELGALIARQGWVVLTGGRASGVMQAAAHGAREAGGLTLGILPGDDVADAAEDLDLAVVTGMGNARNNINVLTSAVIIACGMGRGTASEVALALKIGRPVVLLGVGEEAWTFFRDLGARKPVRVMTPEEAVQAARGFLARD